MGDKSRIEWTDATWNPVLGCTKVSPGCTNCYAIRVARRMEAFGQESYRGLTRQLPDGSLNWTGELRLLSDRLDQPLRWRRPRRIFVNSMSDLFHESVPDEFIARVFRTMARAPQHTYQVLTKRPERMLAWMTRCADSGLGWITHNGDRPEGAYRGTGIVVGYADQWPNRSVWLGVSVEHQAAADERIPLLLQTPAAVRFLSCEPQLGPLELERWLRPIPDCRFADLEDGTCGHPAHPTPECHAGSCPCLEPRLGISWVIVGGESGKNARPMHPDWAREIRDQCVAAGVAFYFKQWGSWRADFQEGVFVGFQLTGKKAAGRLLEGVLYDQFPETSASPVG